MSTGMFKVNPDRTIREWAGSPAYASQCADSSTNEILTGMPHFWYGGECCSSCSSTFSNHIPWTEHAMKPNGNIYSHI